MRDAADQEPEVEALWRFSLAFYAVPGVATALVALQDKEGLDVNLILFALWLGVSGRRPLSTDALTAADRAVSDIRTGIVGPLRELRRRLRSDPCADVQRLRNGVKALELTAEKLVQSRLARMAGPIDTEPSQQSRLAVAYANFGLYLGPTRAGSAEAGVIRDALDALSWHNCTTVQA
jgi:uncharacterized protein (TIGR02444 family)